MEAPLLVIIVSAAIYFLPAIVGFARDHHQKAAIFVLTLLLGWTLIGWVGALVWAFMKPSQHEPQAGA